VKTTRQFDSNGTPAATSPGESAIPDADDIFLTAAQVRRRYGGVSDMTLHRWLHDLELDFCQPIIIGRRRYWKLSDLQKFERRRVGQKIKMNERYAR
jgi:hypothetical protein